MVHAVTGKPILSGPHDLPTRQGRLGIDTTHQWSTDGQPGTPAAQPS